MAQNDSSHHLGFIQGKVLTYAIPESRNEKIFVIEFLQTFINISQYQSQYQANIMQNKNPVLAQSPTYRSIQPRTQLCPNEQHVQIMKFTDRFTSCIKVKYYQLLVGKLSPAIPPFPLPPPSLPILKGVVRHNHCNCLYSYGLDLLAEILYVLQNLFALLNLKRRVSSFSNHKGEL